jgi:hypothetical protein
MSTKTSVSLIAATIRENIRKETNKKRQYLKKA